MRPMNDRDLDEVDLCLLDLISYVRRYGVSPGQAERFLRDRLRAAFDVSEEFEDELSEFGAFWAGNKYKQELH